MGDGMFFLGVLMGLLSAFTLAVSMNVQEFALAAAEDQKLIVRFGRNPLWIFGLILYLVSQGFFVAALSMASQTLVSALFAYCLIFDALMHKFSTRDAHHRFQHVCFAKNGKIKPVR